MKTKSFFDIVALSLFLNSTLSATMVVFDSLNTPLLTGEPLNSTIPGWGQSFYSGDSQVLFQHVDIRFGLGGNSGSISVSLHADGGHVPGILLGQLDGPEHPTAGLQTYTALDSYILEGSLFYWIVVSDYGHDPSDIAYSWLQGRGSPAVGSHNGSALNISGNGFSPFRDGGPDITLNEPLQMRVNGTDVGQIPEPSLPGIVFSSAILLWIGKKCLTDRSGGRKSTS